MKTIATNKKGLFDYEILEKTEAGLVLTGPEVKSVKAGQINLSGSYISFDKNNEPWLLSCHISPYKPAALGVKYKPERPKKLLLQKKEIISLRSKLQSGGGLTILPVSVYNKKGLIKVEIGVARGRRKFDKREVLKKRAVDKEIRSRLRKKG